MQGKTGGLKKRFICEIEFEAAYGLPRKTLQKMRLFGKGPRYRKFGKAVRYDVADIETWIEAQPSGGGVHA